VLSFENNDEAVDYYVDKLKCLLDLVHEEYHAKNIGMDRSFHNSMHKMHAEPDVYTSDSSDSKYSAEDREDKDHILTGYPAIERSMKKLKNANKIVQMNEVTGMDDKTSHVVAYFNEINKKSIIPKSLGMVRRKDKFNQIDMRSYALRDEYADAFSEAIGRAKYVDKLILNNVGLNDEKAIKII